MILLTRITLITLVCCLIRPVMSWDQGFEDEEEYEGLRSSVVYLSTYNCDLSPTVCLPENLHSFHPTSCPYTNRRKAQIEEMNRDEMSDVLCLQGIWYAKDMEAILTQTTSNFPYAYSFLHNESGHYNSSQIFHPPCSEQDTAILKTVSLCEYKECHFTHERTKIFKCIEDICGIKNIMQQMSETCLGCIFQGTESDNFMECTKASHAFNPTGLLVLSKYKLRKYARGLYHSSNKFDEMGREMSSEIVQRGYLDVKVNHIGRVVCTHLTEKFGDEYVEVADTFQSYKDKNFYEFEALYRMFHGVQKAIVMGDLNSSPSLSKGNIAPQYSSNLEVLRDDGFQDPVSDSFKNRIPDCSYCCGNVLVHKPETGVCAKVNPWVGYIFDHVMVKGFRTVDTQEDYLKNNAVNRIFLVEDQFIAMSRHYGFSVPLIVR